jgi:ribonuclease VapC
VLARRAGETALDRLDGFLQGYGVEVMALTPGHTQAARDAFLHWGKGRHPAGLNFDDCKSYAVPKMERLPLLFVGDDFSKTDVQAP